MTRPVIDIPITINRGVPADLRARLSDALEPVPEAGQESSGVWAFCQYYRLQNGHLDDNSDPYICHGAIGAKTFARTNLTLAPAAIQDRLGGIAWALLGAADHNRQIGAAMKDPTWFSAWSVYTLSQGTLVCPQNPSDALGVLKQGFDASEMNDKIARGVFSVQAEPGISNHARLQLAAQASRLIAGLLDFFGPPDIPDNPLYRVRPAA